MHLLHTLGTFERSRCRRWYNPHALLYLSIYSLISMPSSEMLRAASKAEARGSEWKQRHWLAILYSG